jgi:hypothetical protein
VQTTTKVTTGGDEVVANILHPNGNIYDQVLLRESSATITADAGQATRLSFVDLQDNIVQIEFSGAGSLTVTLDNFSGPAPARYYNQPEVSYMRGHATITIVGANESTNVSVFSVGRMTATNQALFRSDVSNEGTANIALIAISSTDGRFGGVWTANASYFHTRGLVGIYAPGVQFTGPVYVNDISASLDSIPVLVLGSATDVRVAGGDMTQPNIAPVQISGISQLRFTAGTNSHGKFLPALENRGAFENNGADITYQVVQQQ